MPTVLLALSREMIRLTRLGGEEFDQRLQKIRIRKIGEQTTGAQVDMLPSEVEATKIYLSGHETIEQGFRFIMTARIDCGEKFRRTGA